MQRDYSQSYFLLLILIMFVKKFFFFFFAHKTPDITMEDSWAIEIFQVKKDL